MKENIKHLKLTNNDEIVCELVNYPDSDEGDEIVIKRALKIITVEDYFRGFRFFAFRPWLSFQDDPATLQSLNASHIIVTANPSPDMLKYYKATIRAINAEIKKHGNRRKAYENLDEIQKAVAELTDEEMEDFLAEKYGKQLPEEETYGNDSDNGNVIKFKPRPKTVH